MAFDRGEITLQSKVKIRLDDIVPPLELELGADWEEGQSLTLETTLGRALFNDTLPADYPFVNYEVGKKALGAIVNDLAERYTKVEVAASLDALKDAGFHWATRSGVTVSIDDVTTPAEQGRDPRAATRRRPPRSRSSSSAVWSPTRSVARSSSRSGPRRPTRSPRPWRRTSTGRTRSS